MIEMTDNLPQFADPNIYAAASARAATSALQAVAMSASWAHEVRENVLSGGKAR